MRRDLWLPATLVIALAACSVVVHAQRGGRGAPQAPPTARATLKLETDAGMQARVFQFGSAQGSGGDWQGLSIASWDYPRAAFAGRGGGSAPGGSLKVITTRMKPGYLRKNGVPYSADAVLTEYFDRFDVPGGDSLLVITTEVMDAEYLATPYWTSQQFKRESDASRWTPTPCTAR